MSNDALTGEIVTASHDIARLEQSDRTPFLEILSVMVGPDVRPDAEGLKEWAAKFPDRYFYSLKIMAGLAGFADKVEISGALQHEISRLPDSELLKRWEKAKESVGGPQANGAAALPAGDDPQKT